MTKQKSTGYLNRVALPQEEGRRDASPVAEKLCEEDSVNLSESLTEVKTELDAVRSDVQDIKDVVLVETPAPAGVGTLTPVLFNGVPATAAQTAEAHEELARARRS